MNKPNIIWKPEVRKVNELKHWEKNPRTLTDTAFTKLKERIIQRGFHDVLKIDTDGTVLSGNQRMDALTDLGIEEVNVLVPERKLTDEEMDKVALESNITDGKWDFDELANEFDIAELLDVGFTENDLGMGENAMDEVDKDDLTHTMDTYLDGSIKQITLYFSAEQFDKLIPKLDEIMQKEGLQNHTEVFLKILEHYENTRPE